MRKKQAIKIGEDITVMVDAVSPNGEVKLGIDAPKNLRIRDREERPEQDDNRGNQ